MWTKTGGKVLPYIYNEEAQVGILAIAAERIGGFPFMEFDQDKRTQTGRGKQDLEIISSDNRVWSIEAKYLVVDPADDNLESSVEKKMKLTVRAVKKLVNRKVGNSMAIVFVRPYNCTTDSECEAFAKRIRNLISSRFSEGGFAAIHFCREDVRMKSEHRDSPGIAILGRYVR
jgi:hypothetical protein